MARCRPSDDFRNAYPPLLMASLLLFARRSCHCSALSAVAAPRFDALFFGQYQHSPRRRAAFAFLTPTISERLVFLAQPLFRATACSKSTEQCDLNQNALGKQFLILFVHGPFGSKGLQNMSAVRWSLYYDPSFSVCLTSSHRQQRSLDILYTVGPDQDESVV